MMYNKKMVASVKCGGKVMREHGDTVYIPYGSEYSLLLKNLSTQRALVNIEIDGKNVVKGGLIVGNNQSIDLERFVIDNDLNKGPRFRFIEKTENISNTRGDRVDDGIIRVSYKFEKPPVTTWYTQSSPFRSYPSYYDGSVLNNISVGSTIYGSSTTVNYCNTIGDAGQKGPKGPVGIAGDKGFQGDQGITTYGSESNQKFQTGSIGSLEYEEHVIVLNLKGDIGQVKVSQPIFVKTKIKCEVCGHKNPSLSKFCGDCGTNLSW